MFLVSISLASATVTSTAEASAEAWVRAAHERPPFSEVYERLCAAKDALVVRYARLQSMWRDGARRTHYADIYVF